jgi:hypothetical protein
VICSERAWRAGVVAAAATFPVFVLSAIAVAVRYGPLTLVVSALVLPSVLLLVAVVVERSAAALEQQPREPALQRPGIAGHH